MTEILRKKASFWVVALGIILTGLLTGCQTHSRFSDLPQDTPGRGFHVGDTVNIAFLGNDTEPVIPEVSQRITEDGTISLSLIGSVKADGKTVGDLQKEIHDLYVPKYFPELSVTVKGQATFFYVDGEVSQRGAKEYPGDMTIVKAITAAGGFTDFAKQTKVRLTRGNHTQIVNVKKAISDPKYDVPVYPGDKIHVPRRILW